MKSKLLSIIAATLMIQGLWAQPQALQVTVLHLHNGMTVWLNEDHSQPKIYGGVVVRAGAKDCPDTGIAHYFEHMMFKGTDRIGTIDYAAERPWLDSIAAQYDLLSQTTDPTLRMQIQQHINELSIRAGDYAIPNEFSRLISLYGGTGLNAGTGPDMTVYYNTFLPQYIEQWCWLNSERLISPVFRGFQAELENVYEEKNRASDGLHAAYDAVMRAVFRSQPYAYPVLGSTEHLKNPRLTDMAAFFSTHYVAPNMCLMLSGDLPADSLLPLLERTFGRVQTGPVPERTPSPLQPFAHGQQAQIRLPIPIVKAEAMVFPAPTTFQPDAMALLLANRLLSDDKAGMLDSLINEHRLMMAGAMHTSLNDAAVTALYMVPRLPFGSKKKAEALCLAQLDRLMQGDFSDELLEMQRQDLLLELEKGLETIERRAEVMVEVFSSGHTWQQYLNLIESLRLVTKADVVAAARKYYGQEHLTLHKKYGTERKETLTQPGYQPLQPRNAGARSDFALWLDSLPIGTQPIRTVDFDNDVVRTPLTDHAMLYSVTNPVNDIFTLTLSYHNGTLAEPRLQLLSAYLSAVGTDSLRKQQMETAWQRIGVTMECMADQEFFTFRLTGRDANLEPALQLLAHFMAHAAIDNEALNEIKQEERVDRRGFGRQKDDVLLPLIRYVSLRQQSEYLQQPSLKEIKKLTPDSLLSLLSATQQFDCDIIYVGRRPIEQVATLTRQSLPLHLCSRPATIVHRRLQNANDADGQSIVYFYHVPRSRQNYVCSYQLLPALPDDDIRATARLWAHYMGGGMSSLLFQNIREFRSLAYSTQGVLIEPRYHCHSQDPTAFVTITGTQADKTMQVLSLIHI